MTTKEKVAEILRYYHAEKWKVGTISTQLGIHHSVVRRVLSQDSTPQALQHHPRKVSQYLPFITETLEKHPTLTASRIFDMVKERGYTGKISQFRSIIAEIRKPKYAQAYFRLKTLPGEQAQVDWGHFGHIEIGKARRPIMGFVMVLSYSRAIFLHFFLSQNMSSFILGHQLAFNWFGGVPRVCLYDNLSSVVTERFGNAIRFNDNFTEFAAHYRFEPRPVNVARGNEKGRVERSIQYIRTNFFAARHYKDNDELIKQALVWCETNSLERRWIEDQKFSVGEIFLKEKPYLLSLPSNPFVCDERKEVSIGKTPYARFDLNDYSVPANMVRKTLTIFASTSTVRIFDAQTQIAQHTRSFDRGQQIEDPSHIEELRKRKQDASQHRDTNFLSHSVPSSIELLKKAAEKNYPLRHITSQLIDLLNTYGADALEAAIQDALKTGASHPKTIQRCLEKARKEQGQSPLLPASLPSDTRFENKNMLVKPYDLASYNSLLINNNSTK